MNFIIEHQLPGRIRVRCTGCAGRRLNAFSWKQAEAATFYLEQIPFVRRVKVYTRIGTLVVEYCTATDDGRNKLIKALRGLNLFDEDLLVRAPEHSGLELNDRYRTRLCKMLLGRLVRKIFLPFPLRLAFTCYCASGFFLRGLESLYRRRLDVPVLDASAIVASLLRGSSETAGSVMFLLRVGGLLEEWTYRKSVNDLARSMSLNVADVWTLRGGEQVAVPLAEVKRGDLIYVKTGLTIPLDGEVVDGEAMVNQASLTGESLPVRKGAGLTVYAGTTIAEGDLTIRVTDGAGDTRYERIVQLIESSEKLKSTVESKALNLADGLVPYTLAGTLGIYALTRNVTKAMSILMVDFSCALKLAIPLSVLSAMRQCTERRITVKGGKFMEAVAEADVIVFDKTGTLTKAQPHVADVVTFARYTRKKALTYAACLEEHFPHSVANAIVRQAADEGFNHAEMHAQVEYIVAHGIASYIGKDRVVIGSAHFVLEDEKCQVPPREQKKFDSLPTEYSHIYLAVGGQIKAVICISDPVREEAPRVLRSLREVGFKKLVMMTGDSERTAAAVAAQLGLDEYYAEVLPEDKARYVEELKREGHKVLMVGDGINDSPALSAADVGVAIAEGADIAREVADITIGADSLEQLVNLKILSLLLLHRINSNFKLVVGFNTALIALGVLGMLPPATSALLHNLSTVAIGLHSMTDLESCGRFAV